MSAVSLIIFLGVFAVVGLIGYALLNRGEDEAKKALASLESALVVETRAVKTEMSLDVSKTETLSTIPWLNQSLRRMEITPQLNVLLKQANLDWTIGRLLMSMVVAFLVPFILVLWRLGMPAIALAVGVAFGSLPLMYVRFLRDRRFNKFEAGLPEAIDLMTSGLRAGHSLISAFGLVSRESPDPIGSEFRLCFEEQNYGLDMKTALDNLTTRMPLQDLRIICTAIMIQKESGGNLAELLEKSATTVRERFRIKRQVKVHTAQGRMTGWILTAMPIGLGFLMYLLNPKLISVLWTKPTGIKLLEGGIVLIIIGALAIRRIVDIDV